MSTNITFRHSYWSIAVGAVIFALAAGFAFMCVWVAYLADDSGKETIGDWLIVMLTPVLLIGCAVGMGAGLLVAWQATWRCVMTADGLSEGTWLRAKFALWSDIVDFAVRPGTFPEAPNLAVLRTHDGQSLTLPLDVHPEGQAGPTLMAHLPMLAEHGLDTVREVPDSLPSSFLGDWIGSRIVAPFILYGFLVLVAPMACGLALYGADYINYLRIKGDPVLVEGEILDIKETSDDVWVRVRYEVEPGHQLTMRREVLASFPDSFEVGNTVTVEYLRGRPEIARIGDWDLDGRQWVHQIIGIPLVLFFLAGVAYYSYELFKPVQVECAWLPAAADGSRIVWIGNAGLETLHRVFADRHRDAGIVFTELKEVSADEAGSLDSWQEILAAAQIEGRVVGERFLILDRDAAGRLLGRLGSTDTVRAQYILTHRSDIDDIESWVLRDLVGEDIEYQHEEVLQAHFFHINRYVGPFNDDELPGLFDRWIKFHLQQLYDNAGPSAMLDVDFVDLFGAAKVDQAFDIRIQRGRRVTRIWTRQAGAADADCAEFTGGQWHLWPNRPAPRSMRAEGCLFKSIRLAFLSLMPLAWLYSLLHWPFARLEQRKRRRKLAEARQKMLRSAGDESADAASERQQSG